MEICSLYNRLGQLIRKRANIKQTLNLSDHSENGLDHEEKMRLEKQLDDVTANITELKFQSCYFSFAR